MPASNVNVKANCTRECRIAEANRSGSSRRQINTAQPTMLGFPPHGNRRVGLLTVPSTTYQNEASDTVCVMWEGLILQYQR